MYIGPYYSTCINLGNYTVSLSPSSIHWSSQSQSRIKQWEMWLHLLMGAWEVHLLEKYRWYGFPSFGKYNLLSASHHTWNKINSLKGVNTKKEYNFVNIHAPNIGASKYIKQILTDLKENIDNDIIISHFHQMDRSSRQNINIESLNLNFMLDQIDLTDIWIFHPAAIEYTFSSSSHRTISRIDHMLYHETILNKLKKTEILSSIFHDHNSRKLGINCKNKTKKLTNRWRVSNMLLNNQWHK